MRRFPPPWTVERLPGGFKVIDANGQSLAYFYARENDQRREHRRRADDGRGKEVGEQLREAARATSQRRLTANVEASAWAERFDVLFGLRSPLHFYRICDWCRTSLAPSRWAGSCRVREGWSF